MAEPHPPPPKAPIPAASPPQPPRPKANPAFAAMGMPNLRAKLPSRNWLIFFGVVGAWSGLVFYDRRQKKIAKEHWCSVVSPLADEPLPPLSLPRKVTVYLAAPPGDNVIPAREIFTEYVKPILNAAAVDFDVVEGRKEGDVWRNVRDTFWAIRRGDSGEEDPVEELRARAGVKRIESVGGALVMGRHTWKEWVRGHEDGWLAEVGTDGEGMPAKREAMQASELPERRTEHLSQPVMPVRCPNLLGFLNTPWRIHRYLTQRRLADDIGREVAALCFAQVEPGVEARDVLVEEEKDWPKSTWKAPPPEPEPEKPKVEEKKEQLVDTAVETATATDTAAVEEKKEEPKKEEKKKWVSPGIWREEFNPDPRVVEGLRTFVLPAEAERKPEDFRWF